MLDPAAILAAAASGAAYWTGTRIAKNIAKHVNLTADNNARLQRIEKTVSELPCRPLNNKQPPADCPRHPA